MTGFPDEVVAAAFNVAAAPPSPLTHLERALGRPAPLRLLAALGRHAHQLACEASRSSDGTVHDLLTDDRAHVLARIDRLERAPATDEQHGACGWPRSAHRSDGVCPSPARQLCGSCDAGLPMACTCVDPPAVTS